MEKYRGKCLICYDLSIMAWRSPDFGQTFYSPFVQTRDLTWKTYRFENYRSLLQLGLHGTPTFTHRFLGFSRFTRSSKMFHEQAAILATGELWSLNLQKKSIPRLDLRFFRRNPLSQFPVKILLPKPIHWSIHPNKWWLTPHFDG